jgi:transglutaminase-like putative cysteine protease
VLISIRHVTRYDYAAEATYAIQSLRLTPLSFASQKVLSWTLTVSGTDKLTPLKDGAGNLCHLATVTKRHAALVIEASGQVETVDRSGMVQGIADPVPLGVYMRETPLTAPDKTIRELAAEVASLQSLERLHKLSQAVFDRIAYTKGVSDAATTAAAALAAGKGVCQDHAHVFISAARVLGVPARYVTGYMVISDEETEIAHEAHHAWAEAHVAGLGWIGFDIANRICPTDRYVRLACGLDAGYAAPIRGSRRAVGVEKLTVEVNVVPAAKAQTQTQSQGKAGQNQSQSQSSAKS